MVIATPLSSNTRFGQISEPAPSSQSSFGFPTSSGTGTVFGVPNTPKIDFKSTPGFGFNSSNAATASTNSSIFGVRNPSTGFTTGTSHAFPSTTSGFVINSNSANASTSSIFGVPNPSGFATGFTTGTSYVFPSTTSGFGINSTDIFGIKSLTESPGMMKLKPTTGSRLSPYSATRVVVEFYGKKCTEKLESISAMPVYETKSHEELRLEDYELLRNKGSSNTPFGPKPEPAPSIFGFGSSHSATGSTNSSIFGVPNPSSFATGFTTGTSHAFPSTTPGFGINSTKTPGFVFNSTSRSDNNNIFGIKSLTGSPGATKLKPTTGSRLSPYSATCVPAEVNVMECTEKFQSISAMRVYQTKSHEELRLEDYELLRNKGFPGATKLKPTTGSRLSPYSATCVPAEVNVMECTEKFQSISAMRVYQTKSHEELRLEDYELLRNKGFPGATKLKPTTGSRLSPYSATCECTEKFQSISAMRVYQTKSHEELRLEDYELLRNKGFPGATKLMPTTGSRLSPYSATCVPAEVNVMECIEKIQSISAMRVYQTKSHEELRLEDYELLRNHVRVYYPADESSIESLEKKEIIDCSICLDQILIGAEGLPCRHLFH
ncbi:hypothetical protein CASFOL_035644 [Castilleja foliolosa]|uniref:Uncharacterized protein n=1 Tax=Castilleja foliolosa TaxID=1961234 RepID=A0ABD3BVK0_9LAMI